MRLVAFVGQLRSLPREPVGGSVHWVGFVLERVEVVRKHRIKQDVIERVEQRARDRATLSAKVVPDMAEERPRLERLRRVCR